MLKPKILIPLILILVWMETTEQKTLYVRYYICDHGCPMDQCGEESEEEESKVCTHIIETDPSGSYVTFPNKCAFDCANKCYEYQLTATPGACDPNLVLESSGKLTADDKSKPSAGVSGNAVDDEDDEDEEDEE